MIRFFGIVLIQASFLVASWIVFLDRGLAVTMTCQDVFSMRTETPDSLDWNAPDFALMNLLGIDAPSTRRDRQARKFIRTLQLQTSPQEMSPTDLQYFIDELFALRYGSWISLSNPFTKESLPLQKQRVQQILLKEIATRGLESFLATRGLLRDKNRFKTKLKLFINAPTTQVLFSVSSLFSVLTPTPAVFLPRLHLRKLTAEEIQTLLLYGVDSLEGEKIIDQAWPLVRRSAYFEQLAHRFNQASLAWLMGFILYLSHQDGAVLDDDDEMAEAQSEHLMEKIYTELIRIEPLAPSLAKTKNDILYELTIEEIHSRSGSAPSAETLKSICALVKSQLYCGSHGAPPR